MKPNTYKVENVRMLVMNISLKMKNLTPVKIVTHHVKNAHVHQTVVVSSVMITPT